MPVLNDFSTTVTLLRRRDESEMRSEEARTALRNINSPSIEIQASFDSKILLELKPEIFLKLCMIQHLLVPEAKPEKHYIQKKDKKLS